MSTRCNVVLQETWKFKNEKGEEETTTEKIFFYRHSDGYPEGVRDTLLKFVDLINKKLIRNNPCQAGGWLIILGAQEYDYDWDYDKEPVYRNRESKLADYLPTKYEHEYSKYGIGWKVGAYEPTTDIHGDIEYLYTIDFSEFPVKCMVDRLNGKKPTKLTRRTK